MPFYYKDRLAQFCKNPVGRFYIFSLLIVTLPLSFIFHSLKSEILIPWDTAIFYALGEALLILIPFWWIKKNRWLTLIPVWLSTIFILMNLMMMEWCGEILSFRSIFMVGNVNQDVTSNLPSLISFSFIFVVISIILYTVYYFVIKRKMKGVVFSAKASLLATLVSIIIFGLSQFMHHLQWHQNNMSDVSNTTSFWDVKKRINETTSRRSRDFATKGYVFYTLKNIVDLINPYELTDDDKATINNYLLRELNHDFSNHDFSDNRNKNLIIILTESLDADAITAKIDSLCIMPNLNSLVESNGSISSLNVVPQITDGISGDGQLMLNTGLLPIRNGSANIEHGGSTNYISLCKILGLNNNSTAIFSENGIVWAEVESYYAFGHKRVITSLDYSGEDNVNDDVMLDYASNQVKELQSPFLLQCLTVSMHSPFESLKIPMPQWIAKADLSDTKKRYYQACNHFDTALGQFIDKLKEAGKWENTVFIVVSDHSIHTDEVGDARYSSNIPMAFIAANTGVTKKFDKVVGQIDVFPTILDIMGVAEDSVGVMNIEGKKVLWRGLGNSMFSDKSNGAVDPRGGVHGEMTPEEQARKTKAYEISDMMIRGYYLNQVR